MKTVLFVLHNTNYYSGATRSMTDIIVRLHKEQKIIAKVLVPEKDGSAIDVFNECGIQTLYYAFSGLMQDERSPLWRRIFKLPLYVNRLLQQRGLARQLVDELSDIDVIYSNTSTVFLGALIAKQLEKPHVWHFREFRHEDHKIHFFLGEKYHMRFAASNADAYIMISKSMVEKHRMYLPKEKIKLIYNELPDKYILPRRKYNLDCPLKLLIAGDVKPGKGQLEVVEAVGKLKQAGISVFLDIAGKCDDEAYLSQIKHAMTNYGINDRITFHGMVKDMNSLRSDMDVGIVASSLEAFGRVTIEGMLGRLCMIGCNSGGTKELIEDGNTGLLYEPNDIDGLTACIRRIDTDRRYLSMIAERGFNFATSNFTNGACSKEIYRVIEEI